ncbi:MAG: penicillin-binding protein 2 [Epsilonproteobacteria bacterium]|nr:penicillin-binding protein 2 [Campylobacterota bacterium]
MLARRVVLAAREQKIWWLLCGFCCFITIITLRLFYLQIVQNAVLQNLGERNFLKTEVLTSPRGTIRDCNGRLLASNRPVFDVYWQGGGQTSLSSQQQAVLEKLGEILDDSLLDGDSYSTLLRSEKYGKSYQLARDVNFSQLCKVSEQCADIPNISIEQRFARFYPQQHNASHVLGYLNRSELVGRAGIEHTFDQQLQGKDGFVVSVINSAGKMLERKQYKSAQSGADLTLTLDCRVQELAQRLFEKDQSGAFVLMNCKTGAVKALVSYPTFDPNLFLNPFSSSVWDELMNDNPLLNRATKGLYPPASLFKMITLAAGFEEGIIFYDQDIECKGYVKIGGRRYNCMRKIGHGNIAPKRALAVSCNVPFFEIARHVSVDTLAMYARCFGLGQKTGFLLPEREGLVPCASWKMAYKGERWWKGETLSVSIGQGDMLVTPLQMARMSAGICTGLLVKPRLLETEPIEQERIDISIQTLQFLQDAMREVVLNGTARRLNKIEGFEAYAKTGTAQTCGLKTKKLSKSQLEHAWTCGFFSYEGSDPLAFVVLIENVGLSRPALNFAEKFLQQYKKLMSADQGQKAKAVVS